MKKTDIAIIVFIIGVSAGIAYFVANNVFGSMIQEGVKVKTVDPITSKINEPDTKIFNENAINPSIEVNISETGGTTTTSTDTGTNTNTNTNTNTDTDTDTTTP